MVDAVDIYTPENIDEIDRRLTERLGELRRDVNDFYPDRYPDDYLYHPLRDKQGDPLIIQVGDEYFAGMATREGGQEGADFDRVVLMKPLDWDNWYNHLRPDAETNEQGISKDLRTGEHLTADSALKEDAERYWQDESLSIMSYYNGVQIGSHAPSFKIDDAQVVEQVINLRYPEPSEFRKAGPSQEEIDDTLRRSREQAEGAFRNPGNAPAPSLAEMMRSSGVGGTEKPENFNADARDDNGALAALSQENTAIITDIAASLGNGTPPGNVARDVTAQLYDIARNQSKEQFAAVSSSVVEVFKNHGHDEHAGIFQKYAEAVSVADDKRGFRAARNEANDAIAEIKDSQRPATRALPIEAPGDKDPSVDFNKQLDEISQKLLPVMLMMKEMGLSNQSDPRKMLDQTMADMGLSPAHAEGIKAGLSEQFEQLSECLNEMTDEQRTAAAVELQNWYAERDTSSIDAPNCDSLLKP